MSLAFSRKSRGMTGLLALSMGIGLLNGCAHKVAFGSIRYPIETKKETCRLVGVIDQATLDKTVPVRAASAGIAHRWDIRTGEMLKQVADVELPQMFSQYDLVSARPTSQDDLLMIEMTVPEYHFENFQATVSVHVVLSVGDKVLLEETYIGKGIHQGGKVFWGGATAMKSAIRQSSLSAYKKVFDALRTDLDSILLDAKALRPLQ